MEKKVILCRPNGFCAGVERAIRIVDLALEAYGAPIYVNHEIVHNQYVVDDLSAKGAVFVNDDLEKVPHGARLIYSAHGVSPQLREEAKSRELIELDATCPLVTKVHMEALRFARKGFHIFLIGHAYHVEVRGTYGEVPEAITIVEPQNTEEELKAHIESLPDPGTDKLIYLTQTTLNVGDCLQVVDALKERFPSLIGPPKDDICYATTNRQNAVKEVARSADFFIVVGSPTSSNSKRLVEVAKEYGCPSDLFPDVTHLDKHDLLQCNTLGLTAGASTPDVLIQAVIDRLKNEGFTKLETYDHVIEDIHFTLPGRFRMDLEEKGITV
jgi:4-hydroxy-3-methylbut-2-enyl diphosphate reductase